jgi:hypothetical protein
MALSHTIESKVEAAYRRGDLFDKRRVLMDEWSKFCSSPAGTEKSKIVLFKSKEHKQS